MSLLFTVSTAFVVVEIRFAQLIFIDNQDYPGGPWAYYLSAQPLPINLAYRALTIIMSYMGDCLLVSARLVERV